MVSVLTQRGYCLLHGWKEWGMEKDLGGAVLAISPSGAEGRAGGMESLYVSA